MRTVSKGEMEATYMYLVKLTRTGGSGAFFACAQTRLSFPSILSTRKDRVKEQAGIQESPSR
jgi:hypothetical protein